MTPKEKAEELVLKFREVPIEDSLLWYVGFEISKEFALIAVDEIINALKIADITSMDGTWYIHEWLEVKQEIESL